MLHNLKQRKIEGFTIIEVMIVLAIAGLIMLIVFLAVPALQRNAHNTSIKNDVAGILAGMNEYSDNNNGTLPTAAGTVANSKFKLGPNTTCAATDNCVTVKVGYVDTVSSPTSAVSTTAPALGTVKIFTKATCAGTNDNTPTGGGSGRQFVAFYTLEGGSVQCQAS